MAINKTELAELATLIKDNPNKTTDELFELTRADEAAKEAAVVISLSDAWEKSKRIKAKLAALVDNDPEIAEGLAFAAQYYQAQADRLERSLRDKGALPPLEEDLIEV